MKKYIVTKKQNNSDMCIVCGMDNEFSPKTAYYELDKKILVGILSGEDVHQSYPNRMHGGIISALLDETIGRAVQIGEVDTWAVTSELTIKYLKPVPLHEKLYVVGEITRNRRLIFEGNGYICTPDGEILAEASGIYFKMPVDKIAGQGLSEDEWKFVPSKDDIVDIILPR